MAGATMSATLLIIITTTEIVTYVLNIELMTLTVTIFATKENMNEMVETAL